MITVLNNSQAVIALKTLGKKNLRLIPGANSVLMSEKEFGEATKDKAIKGYVDKRIIQVVGSDTLSEKEKKQAKEALAKNEKLNTGQPLLKPKKEKKVKAED